MNIVLDGRYQIIKRLGKGGFAYTYLAKNLTDPAKSTCVVKQLRHQVTSPWIMQLFRSEAQILDRFDHSQIPSSVESFEHEGDLFLVQDFIAGDDLSQEFSLGHQWSERKVTDFLREMLHVLGYVHQQNAIHRDLKPANIIRRWDNGKLVLIDFGAVQDLSQKSQASMASSDSETYQPTVVGTPGYVAPEQSEGNATWSSDIYSLGMTAIQFVTGQYPLYLPKDDRGGVKWRDLAKVSDELASILDRMIELNLDARYGDTTSVLADIEALPIVANTFESASSTRSRERPLWKQALIGMAVVSLSISGGYLAMGHLDKSSCGLVDDCNLK
jgi:eukaryotic-like serine/threonine-protein kinase